MNEPKPKAVISAILFKRFPEGTRIYLQTRWKPITSPTYSGMLEIPAGAIDSYENVYDTLKREVKEETNLDITRIVNDYQSEIVEPRASDRAFVFRPYLCQQVLATNDGLPWVGFVFLCEVDGEIKIQESEAKDPVWLSLTDLTSLVNTEPQNFFPLQLPVLKYFIQNFQD